jgi:catechol 2,3-dioxygenase-like lactoylglutathione lyase family enzyme
MTKPLFRKLDNLLLRVSDLDAAIRFYRDCLAMLRGAVPASPGDVHHQ